jgi:predicted bacteriocin transport accessory protein
MAKYKNRNKKETSVKDIEVVEEVVEEEEIEEIDDEDVEEEIEEEVEEVEEFSEDEEEYEEIELEDRIANMEKKITAIFYMGIVTLIIVAISLLVALTNGGQGNQEATDTQNNSSQNSITGYDTSAFKEIKPADIESLSKGKTIVVWIGYQSCSFCQQYAPLLTQVTKEFGITANYIDITTVTEAEFNTVLELTGNGNWKDFAASFNGTPFTLIVKNNKVVGGINGYTEAENIAKAFEDAGLKR